MVKEKEGCYATPSLVSSSSAENSGASFMYAFFPPFEVMRVLTFTICFKVQDTMMPLAHYKNFKIFHSLKMLVRMVRNSLLMVIKSIETILML